MDVMGLVGLGVLGGLGDCFEGLWLVCGTSEMVFCMGINVGGMG